MCYIDDPDGRFDPRTAEQKKEDEQKGQRRMDVIQMWHELRKLEVVSFGPLSVQDIRMLVSFQECKEEDYSKIENWHKTLIDQKQ